MPTILILQLYVLIYIDNYIIRFFSFKGETYKVDKVTGKQHFHFPQKMYKSSFICYSAQIFYSFLNFISFSVLSKTYGLNCIEFP